MTDIIKTTASLIVKKLRYKELIEKLKRDGRLSPREGDELSRLERAIKRASSTDTQLSEREKQRRIMAKRRAAEHDIVIDYSRVNKRRKASYKNNAAGFCLRYFPKLFFNPFCGWQKELIHAVVDCIRYGEIRSFAAPRGGGKSTIIRVVAGVWAAVYGHAKWVVPIGATFTDSKFTLEDIKSYYEVMEGQEDLLGDDFPDVCQPIRALEGNSRRGESQTVGGVPTGIKWGTDMIIFPAVKGSLASGFLITPKSADKAIRGLSKAGRRPDLAWPDDFETDKTARSVMVTDKLKSNLTKSVMGLGGHSTGIGVIVTGTIIDFRCLIAQLTDREKNPIWNGKRFSFFEKWPDNKDLWNEYLYIRAKHGIAASNEFYLKKRGDMDYGAIVADVNSYVRKLGPDGKPLEYSAIQHGYNEIAKMGINAFMSEYQNDPVPDENDLMLLETNKITEKVNGLEKGKKPDGTEVVTSFIDVHDTRLFWSVMAYKPGFIGYTIDYGVHRVNSPLAGSVTKDEKIKQVEVAILESLTELRGWLSSKYNYNMLMIDSGYKSSVVYEACRKFADPLCYPSKGMSSGNTGKYVAPKPGANGVRFIGDGFHQSAMLTDKVWLTLINSDKYKHMVQEGFRVDTIDQPGSLSLYGDDPHVHRAIAEHICDEQWNAVNNKFEGLDGKKSRNNHWLDCLAGCCAGAAMCGIKLNPISLPATVPKKTQDTIKNTVKMSSLRTKY